MAYALVQWATNAVFAGTTLTISASTPLTAGNMYIINWAVDGGKSPTSVSDGTTNYTAAGNIPNSGGKATGTHYLCNVSGSPTITLTTSAAITNFRCWAEEWSGVQTSMPATDGGSAHYTAGSGSSGQSFDSGSFTPGTSGDLIYAWAYNPDSNPILAGAGFTIGKDDSTVTSYMSEFITGTSSATAGSFQAGGAGGFDLFAIANAFKSATASLAWLQRVDGSDAAQMIASQFAETIVGY